MGSRFRRTVKIAPGVRLNVSKGGVSASFGGRGASLNVGARGVRGSVGLPGSGLSYQAALSTQGGGSATVRDIASGAGVTVEQAGILHDHYQLCSLHLATPSPSDDIPHTFVPAPIQPDDVPPPAPSLWERLSAVFSPTARRVLAARLDDNHAINRRQREEWEQAVAAHREHVRTIDHLWNVLRLSDPEAMGEILSARIAALDWPRETAVAVDVFDAERVALDVALPGAEEMPEARVTFAPAGKPRVRDSSATQRRKDYMALVHGIVFRLIGETLAVLPSVQQVIVNGYAQRPNKATGHMGDEYLLSCLAARDRWQRIDFANLAEVDVVEAVGALDTVRDMTKTGIFRPIAPQRFK